MPEISDVLNRVPRQMLLLFKTNDLLRGIETSLDTRANSSSFVTMSVSCVHAQYEKRRRDARSKFKRFVLHLIEYWKILKIKLYAFYLKLSGKTFMSKDVRKSLKTAAHHKRSKTVEELRERKKAKKEKRKEMREEKRERRKERKEERKERRKKKKDQEHEIVVV